MKKFPIGNIFVFSRVDRLKLTVREYYYGGEGGIRTHGSISTTAVFKTAGINHSPTSPLDAPAGLEPTLTESKSAVLPLDEGAMVRDDGFEPPTYAV